MGQSLTLSIIVIETFSKLFYEFREEKSESEELDQMLIQLYRMISQDYQDKTSQAKYTSRKTRATGLQVMVIIENKENNFIPMVAYKDSRLGNGGNGYGVEVEARVKIDGFK